MCRIKTLHDWSNDPRADRQARAMAEAAQELREYIASGDIDDARLAFRFLYGTARLRRPRTA